MVEKPTYEELEQRVNAFETESVEWKQTERKLQESQKRYSTLSEASFEGILIHENGIVVDTNRRFAEMYGYDLDELIGKNALELIPPEHRDTVRKHIASGYEGPYEIPGLRKDSSTFQTEIRVRHMTTDERSLRVAVVGDITEYKQAEKALRIVWTTDREFQTTYVSPSIERVLGFTPEERKRQALEEMVTPASLRNVQVKFLEELQHDEEGVSDPNRPVTMEVEYYHKDGSTVWMENMVSAIRDPDGAIVGIHGVARDITLRKQAEDALRESEERYRSLFNNNHSVMLLINPESGDIVDANPAAISYYGWNYAELTSQKITNINTLKEEQVFHEMEQAGKEHRRRFYFQHGLADGEVRDVEVYSGPIQLRGQQLLYSIVHDITDRRQAEEELKESENLLKATLESTADGILVVNEKGQVLHTNNRFAKMWQIPNDLIKSRDDEKLLSYVLDQLIEPRAFLSKVQELYKTSKESLDTLFFKDGRIFERYSRPLIRSGEIGGRVWSFRDVTERRREQEALRESEEKYRQLVKHAPSGIYEIDYKKNKIINVNDLMCEYSGYTREELLSMNPFDFLTEDSKRLYTERVEKMISGIQVPEKVEFKIRRKDGKELWVLLNIRFVYEDGNIRRATVVAHDIDDRKKAEEILCKTHHELEDKVRERTAELEKSKSKLIKEIKNHKITEKKLRKREKELENKTNDLEELNAALRVLLNKREEDKMTLQDNILSNVKTIIEPYVAKLKQYNSQQGQVTLINIIESNLNEIVSPFTRQLSSKFFNLSPSEIQVANLVKYGKTNKEIAEMLHVTQRTIAFHRENIRKKLGIKNQKTNLKTYLMSLE